MSRLDPSQTIIRLPTDIVWRKPPDVPRQTVEKAVLSGSETGDGPYLVLMKWFPGFMSAPHTYRTDRLCVVVSGTWWCNSGPDFDPDNAQPATAGAFVRRIARTAHYDGVRSDATGPAIIAITGMGPVEQVWLDPSQPWLREV
jgi:hypothetical protein